MDMARDEIIGWLREDDGARLETLRIAADGARRRSVGDEVHLRCLVEISNRCRRDCAYCGLRSGNMKIGRYRMSRQSVVDAAVESAAAGRKTVVIQSGEDPALGAGAVASLVTDIKDKADVAVTLSLGEYSRDEYRIMKDAGADRYLLRHETIDPALYRRLHPAMSYENRLRCLEWLQEVGFQTGSGIMVGLPGQSVECIADDILFMKKMDFDMAGIGPFIPHADTPLGGSPAGTLEMTLKVLALTRIAIPHILMPATTAVGTIHPGGRAEALRWGANVLMTNATPAKYRDLYQIYPGRVIGGEASDDSGNLEALLASLDRKVAPGYGHSRRMVCGDAADYGVKAAIYLNK